jgi:hypothetical protein
MGWFNDDRLKEIYYEGATYGVSAEDCFLIRRKLLILMAVRSRISLPMVGKSCLMLGGRQAVQVTPDWSISFAWFEDVGALAMQLEP